jgi:hypothetical protein
MKKTTFILAICVFWNIFPAQAEERNMLSQLYSEQEIDGLLLSGNSWITFPEYTDRKAWEEIPENIRIEIIRKGEESLNFEWGVVKATDYLEFVRSGDRRVMQDPYSARRRALQNMVLAELTEGEGRFLDQIINGIWALSEQTSCRHLLIYPCRMRDRVCQMWRNPPLICQGAKYRACFPGPIFS